MNINFIGQGSSSMDQFKNLIHKPNHVWECREKCWNLSGFANRISYLRAWNPDIRIGQYCSAAMAKGDDYYPPSALPLTACKDSWFFKDASGKRITWENEPLRPIINITLPEVRDRMIKAYTDWNQILGLDYYALDNCYCDITPTPTIPVFGDRWTTACLALIGELRRATNKPIVANITAGSAGKIPQMITRYFSAVDGMSVEDALHRNIRAKPDLLAKELLTYDLFSRCRLLLLFLAEDKTDPDYEAKCLELIAPIARRNNTSGNPYAGIYCTTPGPLHEHPLHEVGVAP